MFAGDTQAQDLIDARIHAKAGATTLAESTAATADAKFHLRNDVGLLSPKRKGH
jgi:hypothetical protein